MATLNLTLESFAYPSGKNLFSPAQLSIERGASIALVGGSGSGKSSLLTLLAELHPQPLGGRFQGQIVLAPEETETPPERRLGYLGSDPRLFLTGFCQTVLEEVGWTLFGWGWSPDLVEERVQTTLRELALEHLAWSEPRALSGGQQQMVALAAVLARQPRLLLLDEPVSRLDPKSRANLIRTVRGISERTGVAVLWATSKLDEVAWCRTIWHLVADQDGRHRIDIVPQERWDQCSTLAVPLTDTSSTEAPETSNRELALEVQAVRYQPTSAKRPLFENLDWSVSGGQIEALVGVNGAGKTTLARLVRGLTRPSEGSISVGDTQVGDRAVSELSTTVAYTFQDPSNLFLKTNVESELLYSSQLLGLTYKDATRRSQEAIDLFGLRPWLAVHPRELPASFRGLLSVAISWLTDSQLQILDEPLAHLDQPGRVVLERVLRDWRQKGTTTIIIAHDLHWLRRVCSNFSFLHQGRILAQGPAVEVLAVPEVRDAFAL